MTIVLGIDLATAEARVQAVDVATGAGLAERRAPLPVGGLAGERTQAADYGTVALSLVGAVLESLGARAGEVRALSVTGTSGTVVPVDAAGVPVGDAVLYDDPRGGRELRMLADAGLDARPSGALARAAWMHASLSSSASDSRVARFVFTPDVVVAALAGRLLASDTSHALKSGIDPVAGTWNDESLAVLGLPREVLPELAPPGRVLGEVADSLASRLGLPPGVLIVSGMTDGSTGQIATGAVALGDTVGVLGTTLVLKAVSAVDVVDGAAGIYSHVGPDGLFWAGGASNTGAGVLRSGATEGLDPAAHAAAVEAAGPARTVTYPLARPGERFPVADAAFPGFSVPFPAGPTAATAGAGAGAGAGACAARPVATVLAATGAAAASSLTAVTTGAGVAAGDAVARFRAVYEGVAFVERLGLERLEALGVERRRHHLAGGAAASDLWNRIRASVLDRPVIVTPGAGSARGAAALAAAALTGEPLSLVAERFAGARHVVDPDPALVEPFAERYATFTHTLQSSRRQFPRECADYRAESEVSAAVPAVPAVEARTTSSGGNVT